MKLLAKYRSGWDWFLRQCPEKLRVVYNLWRIFNCRNCRHIVPSLTDLHPSRLHLNIKLRSRNRMITVLMWSLSLYHSEKVGYIQLSSTEEEFISTNSLDTYFAPHRAILLISQKHVSMGHQQSYQLKTEYPFGNKTSDCWASWLSSVLIQICLLKKEGILDTPKMNAKVALKNMHIFWHSEPPTFDFYRRKW